MRCVLTHGWPGVERSPSTGTTHESVPAVPDETATLMEEVSTEGKLAE